MKARSKYCKRIAYITDTGTESMTQQHFKDQCDINKIARMQEATGTVEHVKHGRERYGDFSEYFDVGTNMDKAAKAQQLFDQVPPDLRKKVGNSIPKFFEFIQDAENLETCYKYGIYDRPQQQEAAPVQNDPAPQSTKSGKLKTPKVQDESPDTE